MSTPFDVDGLWQIRLTITSPSQPSFRTQGYVDESTKDKILATLSEKTQQSSDKLSEATGEHIELLEFVKLAIAQEREAYERVCEERDAIVKDADKAYALLRQALDALIFMRPACFAEIRRTKADAAIAALREWLGVTE